LYEAAENEDRRQNEWHADHGCSLLAASKRMWKVILASVFERLIERSLGT
jgi:hypothetical protein